MTWKCSPRYWLSVTPPPPPPPPPFTHAFFESDKNNDKQWQLHTHTRAIDIAFSNWGLSINSEYLRLDMSIMLTHVAMFRPTLSVIIMQFWLAHLKFKDQYCEKLHIQRPREETVWQIQHHADNYMEFKTGFQGSPVGPLKIYELFQD